MADRLIKTSEPPPERVVLSIIDKESKQLAREIAYRVAAKLAGRLRSVILNQEYDWAPLSDAWLRKKERMGWDPRILRATGEYVNSIVVRRIKEDHKYEVAPSEDQTTSGATLREIGFWLEYGTKNSDATVKMPARPHWRPVWREFVTNQKQIIKEIEKRIRPALKKPLKSRKVRKVVYSKGK